MFTVTRESALPATELWARLAAVEEHTRSVPLTRTIGEPGPARAGWHFTVRTALGPLHFDDTMVVEDWAPPHQWSVRKTGRLHGWARAVVEPVAAGSRLTWTEEIWIGGARLRHLTTPLGDVLGPLLFGRVVDRLIAVTV